MDPLNSDPTNDLAKRERDPTGGSPWSDAATRKTPDPADAPDTSSDRLNPATLKKNEESGGDTSQKAYDDVMQGGGKTPKSLVPEPAAGPTGAVQHMKKKGGLKSFLGRHKKALLFGGVGGGGLVMIVLLLLLLASSLLIPHFFENLLTHRFVSSARSFRRGNEQNLAKKLSIDQTNDSKFAQVKQKYRNIKKIVLLEEYRPKKVVQNMFTTGALDFEESKPEGIFKRKKITALIVDGQRIPLTDQKWYRPFANVSDNFRLASEIEDALFKSQRFQKGTIGTLLRTKTGSQILKKIGVRGLYAWANKGREYRGTTTREADIKMQQDFYDRANKTPNGKPLVKATAEGAEDADQERDKSVRDGGPAAVEILENNGNDPTAVENIIKQAIDPTGLRAVANTVVSGISTTYAIAVPACMIVDASMQRAGPVIDAKLDGLQNTFMMYASGADQQISGETTGEAVKAMARKLNGNGTFARSVPQQQASGGNPDSTQAMMPPEGSAAGDFSVLNVILPEGAAEVANGAANGICPALTNIWVGVGFGIGELVLGFFTGGSATAASKLGAAGVTKAFTVYLGQFAKTVFSKASAKRFVKEGATIGGLALLAYTITEQYSGGTANGLSRGANSANEADAGAVAMNAEMNRKLGGRVLTGAETVQNNIVDRQEIQKDKSSQSVFERYFALDNSQSLASNLVINVAGGVNMSSIGSFFNLLARIFNPANIAHFFASAFSQRVAAADFAGRGNYQMVDWGFSQAEEKAIQDTISYWDVLENDRILMEDNAQKFAEIQAKYGRCFTDTMGTLLSEMHIVRNPDGSIVEDRGLCSPRNLGMNNPEGYGDLVFRWRISIRSDEALQAAYEIANPGTSTASLINGPVTGQGDSRALAAQLLGRADQKHIHLTDNARRDLSVVQVGVPIGSCGANSIHPGVLQVLLAISDPASPNYFKMSINNFVTGHECNNGQHPKGGAADIQNINNSAIESWDTCTGEKGTPQPPCGSSGGVVATQFVNALASVMPRGSAIGQSRCTDVMPAKIPDYVENFPDTCHHIHIDMRNVR